MHIHEISKSQLKENLSGKSVPDDLKYRVVDEIARDNCLQQQVLAIQYYPDWQQVKVTLLYYGQYNISELMILFTSSKLC